MGWPGECWVNCKKIKIILTLELLLNTLGYYLLFVMSL